MKARYSRAGEGNRGKVLCPSCNKLDWFIVIERGGDKIDFNICSHCGNNITLLIDRYGGEK